MANELQNKLNKILSSKNVNLLPEHLKAGVTCLGIEGTFDFEDTDDYGVCNEIAGQIVGDTSVDEDKNVIVQNIINIESSRIYIDGTALIVD